MDARAYDVAVMGGGPAGLSVASSLASMGYSVVLFEEDQEIGYPVKCAGIVSRKGLSSALPKCPHPPEVTAISAGRVRVADHGAIDVDLRGMDVVAMDRRAFDKCLFYSAAEGGVEVRLADRVASASQLAGGWGVASRSGVHTARAVVDARGASAYPRRNGLLYAVQHTCQARSGLEPGLMEVVVDKSASREHFFWVVGLEDHETIVGGAGSSPSSVDAMVSRLASDIRCSPHRLIRSPLVIGGFSAPAGPAFSVGDSAGQSKPTTGGGDITSVQAAKELAMLISRYLSGELSIQEAHTAYRAGWSRSRGKEESMQRLLRAVYERLDDGAVWSMLKSLEDSGALARIAGADFDSLGGWLAASIGLQAVRGLALGWASGLVRRLGKD